MPTQTQHLEQRVAALQSDLNTKDEQIDALTFSDNDRELSRRSWFDEAKRLEKEVEELRAEVKRLDLMGAQSDYNYDQRRAQFDRVLAERDALLRECASEFSTAEASVFEAEMRRKIEAALSASAEPAKSCGACGSCADGCRLDRESPPVERHQGELVHMVRTHGSCCWEEVGSGSLEDFKSMPEEYELRTLYTRPAEQPEPVSSTSDKYKAELYDEVWQLARGMGFGNVTDALRKLEKQLQGSKYR